MKGSGDHLQRVRRIAMAMPGTEEKVSHGAPTFFAKKKVFVMFANNHHDDGHIAIWIPVPPGEQELLIHTNPKIYFRPPYVGVKGWVGIELPEIGDDELGAHIHEAWRIVTASKPKRK